jgi:hypothetical protein
MNKEPPARAEFNQGEAIRGLPIHNQEHFTMESVKSRPAPAAFHSNKSVPLALILVILIGIGLYAYRASKTGRANPAAPAGKTVTQQMLADEYGLGVNLIAVTGAGGMLDLRLKIIDGEKAKALLDDPANFPALRVGNGLVLKASEDRSVQAIKFENGGSIFALFPNAQNIVKPGDPVTIVFGDFQVEAIPAK